MYSNIQKVIWAFLIAYFEGPVDEAAYPLPILPSC